MIWVLPERWWWWWWHCRSGDCIPVSRVIMLLTAGHQHCSTLGPLDRYLWRVQLKNCLRSDQGSPSPHVDNCLKRARRSHKPGKWSNNSNKSCKAAHQFKVPTLGLYSRNFVIISQYLYILSTECFTTSLYLLLDRSQDVADSSAARCKDEYNISIVPFILLCSRIGTNQTRKDQCWIRCDVWF